MAANKLIKAASSLIKTGTKSPFKRKRNMKNEAKVTPASTRIAQSIGKIVKGNEAKRKAQRLKDKERLKLRLDRKSGGGARQGFVR